VRRGFIIRIGKSETETWILHTLKILGMVAGGECALVGSRTALLTVFLTTGLYGPLMPSRLRRLQSREAV